MKEVRIAFYKYKRSWTDVVISAWTWLFNMNTKSYSHVEIGFKIEGVWQYFSSSIPDGGTRWKDGKKLLKNADRWDVFTDEFQDESVDRMIARAKILEGKDYDKLGIMGFVTVTGLVLNDEDAWYCSEACWYILTSLWFKRISPRRMSKRIKESGRDFKQLKPIGGSYV